MRAAGIEHLEPREYLFRYMDAYDDQGEEEHCVGSNEDGPVYVTLGLNKFLIHSKTDCGVWIYTAGTAYFGAKLRFVKMHSGVGKFKLDTAKRFATYTKEEAVEQYMHRKCRQLHILRGQIEKAEIGLKLAKAMREVKS